MNLTERYGKTALVTGASAGIGRAYACELAARGMDVVVVARRRERLDELKRDLEARHGVRIVPIQQDLASPDAAERIATQLEAAGLQIDFLVNNAGFGQWGEFSSYDRRRDLDMLAVNCGAVLDLTHRLLPAMKARRRGAVIIVSSVLGEIPAPWLATYGATKAFDKSLGESLYGELKPYGIDALAILPTLTATEFQAGSGMKPLKVGMRTAEQVVATSLRALGRRPSIADGLHTRLWLLAARLIPRAWLIAVYRSLRTPKKA